MVQSNTSFVKWKYQDPAEFHPFWFEKIDYDAWKQYGSANRNYSYYTAMAYLAAIFILKHVMKNRPPLKLHSTLVLWNLCLGAFSALGFFRTAQELLNVIQIHGLHKSICTRVGLNQPAAFYSVAFALSKFIELGDTIFIVLHKKPLLFIQWYHHCATLLLAWQVMPYSEPIFRYYGVMNYCIHGIMYPYFALKVMHFKVSKVSMLITTLQLLQMVIGVGINLYSAVISFNGSCARDPVSIKWIGFVYASFMILFAHFFYQRYISTRKPKTI